MGNQHTDYELIRNTLAIYPFAVDSKDWSAVQSVFTEDARIHFTFLGTAGEMRGPIALLAFIQRAAHNTHSQHAITTQRIEVTGSDSAEATTYMAVTHVADANHRQKGEVHYAWGKVVDRLVKRPVDTDGTLAWRVQERHVYEQLPSMGELKLFREGH
ncbi:nuclear transport factor 2 family protein [Aspergillus foveolatus]|uniref:nuclear transport factor 2 family protein n=1 Tax=Aspergillus foveolatus TaxID=210207 RepID=UPI003CCE4A4F